MIHYPTASCNGYWLCFITQQRNLTLRNTACIQDAIYQVAYVSKKKLSCQHSDIKTALRNHSQTYTIPWMLCVWGCETCSHSWDFIPPPQRCCRSRRICSPQSHSELTQRTSASKNLKELSNQDKSQASLQPSNHHILNRGRILVSQNNTNDNDAVFFYKSN